MASALYGAVCVTLLTVPGTVPGTEELLCSFDGRIDSWSAYIALTGCAFVTRASSFCTATRAAAISCIS